MSQGILIADKNIQKGSLLYDSREPQFQVATDRTPPHLDIFSMDGGTALVTDAGNGFYNEETLFTLDHNLKYKPKVFVYFYVTSGTFTGYAVGTYFYGFGAIDDYITYRITDTTFSIVHIVDDFLGSGYTSNADIFLVRIKYLICSMPVNKTAISIV